MAAAEVALTGGDPMKFLRADVSERDLMSAVAGAAMLLLEKRDTNLAVHIANNVGKLFGAK